MNALDIAKAINGRIKKLEELSRELPSLADAKSAALAKYEKELKMEMVRLRPDCATTILEKFARGNVSELLQKKDRTESALKIQFKLIDIVQSQLNGYQSINRYLDNL